MFYQLFTIHGVKNHNYTPLIFFLLTGKTKLIYEDALTNLLLKMNELNLNLSPKIIYADFELAIHSALLVVFPNTIRKGCRFHLGQSIWRKIQSVGLCTNLKKKTEIGLFLKLFFGLSFLNPNDVDDCFTNEIMTIQPNDDRIHAFCDYFLETYVMADSLFPPSIWAEFSNSTMRTTNVCESFHSKLNSMFYSPSPNIFQLVDVLKQVQCDVYIKMRSSNLSNRRREILEKENSISLVMTEFQNNEINRILYVEKLAYMSLPTTI